MSGQIDTLALTGCLPFLHRFAYALTRNSNDACDLVQDTIERALGKADLFDGANLRAWLATICRRVFLNEIRRHKTRGVLTHIDDAPPGRLSVDANQESQVQFKGVAAAFETLGVSDEAVLSLIVLEGLKYAEVARKLNVPIGTIRSRRSRARARLATSVESGAGQTIRLATRLGGAPIVAPILLRQAAVAPKRIAAHSKAGDAFRHRSVVATSIGAVRQWRESAIMQA